MIVPVSRFEFTWIDPAVTSPLANQPVASESERARDQSQCAGVTPQVNLSFSFVSCVSKHLIEFIAIELIIGIVVSAIAVFRMVDNILSSSLHCYTDCSLTYLQTRFMGKLKP